MSIWCPFYLRSVCLRLAPVQGDRPRMLGAFIFRHKKTTAGRWMRTKVQVFQTCSSISLLLIDADSKLGSQVGYIPVVTMQRMKIHPGQHESPSTWREFTGQVDLGAPHLYDCFIKWWQTIVSFNFRNLKCVTIFYLSKHVRRSWWMVTA